MRLKHGALKTWFKSPDLLCLYEGLTLKKLKKFFFKSFKNLKQYVGKNAPSRTHVFFCFGESIYTMQAEFRWWALSRTPTAVTVTNIETAGKNSTGPNRGLIATREIQEYLSTGTAVAMSILRDDFRVRERGARYTPHSLTDRRRRGRVEWGEFRLRKFNGGISKMTWDFWQVMKLGAIDMIRKPR